MNLLAHQARNTINKKEIKQQSESTDGVRDMNTKKAAPETTRKTPKVSHPGMMGDGTEEQNLNQKGNPAARIGKEEVEAAFGKQPKDRAK